MKATDAIRIVLDLIDELNANEKETAVTTIDDESDCYDEVNRFKQIAGLLTHNNKFGVYSNEPEEKYSDVDSITVLAGGGLNGPKPASDLRVKDPSSYPNF